MSKVSEKQIELLAEKINEEIFHQRKHLLGKVLTVIDASISDPEQRKAAKDMVNSFWHEGSYWNYIRRQFEWFKEALELPADTSPEVNLEIAAPANPYLKEEALN